VSAPAPDPAYGYNSHGQPSPYPPAYGLPVLASYGQRVGSFLVDVGIPTAVFLVVLLAAASAGDLGVVVTVYGLGSLAMIAFVVWNSGYRQGTTGQSIGKQWLGIRLVGAQTGRPVGFGLAFARQLAHILDGIPFYLGYLWPLWDERRQTFADKVCSTLVVRAGM
jgi:uncharacterized RDD family membrane protein YckC